jgi:hypothetical protein
MDCLNCPISLREMLRARGTKPDNFSTRLVQYAQSRFVIESEAGGLASMEIEQPHGETQAICGELGLPYTLTGDELDPLGLEHLGRRGPERHQRATPRSHIQEGQASRPPKLPLEPSQPSLQVRTRNEFRHGCLRVREARVML